MVITADQAPQLLPIFGKRGGKLLFKIGLKLTGIDKVNSTHDRVEKLGIQPGPDFAKGILDDVGVDFRIGNAPALASLPKGPFIIIANHIYGHLDGICLVDLFGHIRPKTKVMVNEFLMWIHGLAPNFISVTPNTNASNGNTATSINGVKSALLQLKDGEPLGIFPSGAVADLKPREGWTLQERDWQEAAVKLIRKACVPIVPVRFPDHNSWFYYSLGLLDYRVRFARLFHELFNKRGTSPRVIIGETISAERQKSVPESEFKQFLRNSVYSIPDAVEYVKRSELWK
ncbi:MAG: 1-acyl-sn-glycerol-3-phosphate acyltransferase [Bacteroidales bacterium]|nr:1-acyl-sn-glycerol-3-phosphate acyltransferase [Bacteroidales bacterium]